MGKILFSASKTGCKIKKTKVFDGLFFRSRVASLFVLFFLLTLFLPSCLKRDYSHDLVNPQDVLLSIEIPKNKLAFENLSSILYDSLWNHFNGVGYQLSEKNEEFALVVEIKKIDSSYKFLSPDLLTYATKVRVSLFCKLVNKDGDEVAKKNFVYSKLIPRAKDYVENSGFSDFEYKKLFEWCAPKIERYFKRFCA